MLKNKILKKYLVRTFQEDFHNKSRLQVRLNLFQFF